MKKVIQAIIGIACTIIGVALVFKWWSAVVVVFQGVFGGLLAVAGLVMLYLLDTKKK